MFTVNDDLSVYCTRGDYCQIPVTGAINGAPYRFLPGDVVRFKAFRKKDCGTVVIQRDFSVSEESDTVLISLTGEDTKIGEVISKPVDYWYEVELNPDTNPQTIRGYDEDGAKVFQLFPEGKDVGDEDIEVVGKKTLQELVDYALDQANESGAFDGEDGITPHIGENGNWWVGDEDTFMPATGEKGEKGDKGEHGDGFVETPEGGTVLNDYDTNKAPAKFATTFGSENLAAGECSIAGGARIFRSGAEYVVAWHYFDGDTGSEFIAYAADPNGEFAKNTVSIHEIENSGWHDGQECWWDVAEWVAYNNENDIPTPDMIMTADGRFCLLEDVRYNETYGTGGLALGMGAVNYSRAGKSLGYRTQTGYPPSPEIAALRPEIIVLKDENGNPVYPEDNVGQGAVAIGADTAALGNHAFAGGWGSVAKGYHSMAFGSHNEASAECAVAFGNYSKANGQFSIALGNQTEAGGHCSLSGGKLTKATGYGSVALGSESTASGANSFAGGQYSTATGNYSLAFGNTNKATKIGAVAFGTSCEVNGNWGLTNGAYNVVSANAASAFGYHNNATAFAQTVAGQWNKSDSKALFAVGNGTAEDKRSNAFQVNTDGSAKVAGQLSFGSIDNTSRKKILTYKSNTKAPTESDAGDYIGQLWIVHSEAEGIVTDSYIYTGSDIEGYRWRSLG